MRIQGNYDKCPQCMQMTEAYTENRELQYTKPEHQQEKAIKILISHRCVARNSRSCVASLGCVE